jgi:hypothetical protein
VILIDELCVAHATEEKSFLLGGAVSSSIL